MAIQKTLLTLIAAIIVGFSHAQNLIAYYPFSSGANDDSGNSYDGTLFGNTTANDTLETGDNITDYVAIPDGLLSGLDDFTITFEVKFETLHTAGAFPANTIMHAWGIDNEDELKISQNQGSSVFQVSVKTNQVTFPFVANENQWYCFAIVRGNSAISVYIDGQQVGTVQSSGSGSLTPSANGFVLAQEEDCNGSCFAENQSLAGKLDELKFYNYAFTAGEATVPCTTCGDKVFYPFTIDESDSSGNALNGVLHGNAQVDNGILSTGDNDVDYVSVPDEALDGLGNFDVSFAAKFDTIHTSGLFPGNTVIHAWGVSNEDEFKITLDNNTFKFHVSVQGSQYNIDYFPNAGEWNCYHVQRKSDTLFVYANSQLVGVDDVPSGALQIASNGIVLGQEEDCAGGCFAQNQSMAGELDNFRINNCPIPIPKNEVCDFATGISGISQNQFSVYPNPANENISVRFGSAHNATIRVLNDLGREMIVASRNNASSVILSTEKLSDGIYLVEILKENKRVFGEKILVVH